MQTELWYTDEHTKDVRFSMKTIEQIASKRSAVQQIDILDTPARSTSSTRPPTGACLSSTAAS